jgi:RNA-directed DNA polymerase
MKKDRTGISMDEVDAEDRAEMAGTRGEKEGQNPTNTPGAFSTTAKTEETYLRNQSLMEEVLEYNNIQIAMRRVCGNKGAPGVDGMTTEQLKSHVVNHWPHIETELLEGRYQPEPVRGVEIPKPDGKGIRKLGIPTATDRLIQQALHQVLSPIFEEDFSEHSFGFRPGRSTHQAILKAQEYIAEGKRWVVDIDLEKFFDRVNHDILMSRVARKIRDKRVLLLIRRFLQAGLMIGGLESVRTEGTPQGGPLSPLLSNVMLDDLDKELERREHSFCRYADDCNVYVQSQKAGERVMQSIKEFLTKKLKLRVNEEKSAVAQVWERKFLGYTVSNEEKPKLKIAEAPLKRLKDKLRKKFHEGKGRNIKQFVKELKPTIMGWGNYFYLTETPGILGNVDSWIRHKMRDLIWRQLKSPVTRIKAMIQQGVSIKNARKAGWSHKGSWRCSRSPSMHTAYPNKYFEKIGLVSLLQRREYLKAL